MSEGIFSEQLRFFVTFELPFGKSCSGLVQSLDRPGCGKEVVTWKVKRNFHSENKCNKEFKPSLNLNTLFLLSQCFSWVHFSGMTKLNILKGVTFSFFSQEHDLIPAKANLVHLSQESTDLESNFLFISICTVVSF